MLSKPPTERLQQPVQPILLRLVNGILRLLRFQRLLPPLVLVFTLAQLALRMSECGE